MFEIIPAVDILDGKCVRLKQGDYKQKTVYFDDPVEAARHWAAHPIPRLHVVDLNGAKSGVMQNKELVMKIAREVDCPIEVGGGIRSMAIIEELLSAGVGRVILGTTVLEDEKLVKEAVKNFGERIIASLDGRDEYLAIHGWTEFSKIKVEEALRRVMALGIRRAIFTDISRDGELQGPNFAALERLKFETSSGAYFPLIASGGITSIEQVKKLKALPHLEGGIIGKALYTGDINLVELLDAQS